MKIKRQDNIFDTIATSRVLLKESTAHMSKP